VVLGAAGPVPTDPPKGGRSGWPKHHKIVDRPVNYESIDTTTCWGLSGV